MCMPHEDDMHAARMIDLYVPFLQLHGMAL